jgi:lipopolysaccharide exporter
VIKKEIHQETAEPLSKKVVKGGLWVFSLRILNRVLGFIRTIILARLLTPEDFGILGIAMLSISTLETFSQTGFQAALIQKKEHVKSYLDTAWTVSAIRSAILFLVLFFSAPLFSRFFNSPQANLVLKIIALNVLLSGFSNIGIVFFKKELDFQKQFVYEFSATLVDFTIAITLAYVLRSVWALVWGGLAANFVRLMFSYILHPYRPRMCVQKDQLTELFAFGKWVLTSGILVFLVTQGDDIFVGKLLGITALGLYQIAYTLSNLPASEITHVISQVTFPAYSKLQNDLPTLRTAYLKVLQLTAFVSFPLTAGIIVLAPQFIQILLGDKWMPAAPIVQVLALAGLLRSIAATAGYLFYALGKTKTDTMLQLIRLAVLAALIYPLTLRFGLLGVAIAVVASIFVSNIGFNVIAIKATASNSTSFLKMLLIPLINATAVAAILYTLIQLLRNGLFELILCLIVGIVIYVTIAWISDKFFNYGIRLLSTEITNSLRYSK